MAELPNTLCPHSTHRHLHRLSAILLLSLFTLAPHAAAQMWVEWGVEMFRRPALTARGAKEVSEAMGLSPEQRRAVEELQSGYQAEYATLSSRADEITKTINEVARDNPEPGEWYRLHFPLRRKLIQKTDALDRTLLDDVRALLDSRQSAYLPVLERRLRRERYMRIIERGGMQLPELAELMRSLKLDDSSRASIAPAIDSYEAELDQELQNYTVTFTRYYDEWERVIGIYTGDSAQTPEIIKTIAKDLQTYRGRIGLLRRKHLERIQASLSGEQRTAFDEQLYRRLYPAVFKPSRAARVLQQSLQLQDLDEATRVAIKDLKEGYERELPRVNERWLKAIEGNAKAIEKEEDTQKFYAELNEVGQIRKTLDAKLLERIYAVLTPDQRKALRGGVDPADLDLDAPPTVKGD